MRGFKLYVVFRNDTYSESLVIFFRLYQLHNCILYKFFNYRRSKFILIIRLYTYIFISILHKNFALHVCVICVNKKDNLIKVS